MYIPDKFRVSAPGRLHAFVRTHPFATLITASGEIEVSHIPLFLDLGRSQLRGHVARANPHWRAIGDGAPTLAIFNGPQAYVTPQAYPSKREHGRVVPTWNYAVVHVAGQARAVSDPVWLAANVNELSDQQESAFAHAWAVSDAPDDYIDKMLGGIVGIEIAIARIEGKFKLSQNRAEPDRAGVIAELKARHASPEHAMSALMEQMPG
ncbi:MAG: FMN-binding negative transcriptional regulator [Rhodospirillaceae bacterium]|nr:FMN-binding negative transcriptional regulator [Rhodospirillaceae bacterium]